MRIDIPQLCPVLRKSYATSKRRYKEKNGVLRIVYTLTLAIAASAAAQSYPTKPIRVIDAYPPGGTTDVVARIVGQKFVESTGHSWVIDSRPGAQGIIGTELAA